MWPTSYTPGYMPKGVENRGLSLVLCEDLEEWNVGWEGSYSSKEASAIGIELEAQIFHCKVKGSWSRQVEGKRVSSTLYFYLPIYLYWGEIDIP